MDKTKANTQAYFICLLSDYIHQRISAEPEYQIDWGLLAKIAEEQNLCGIIYHQCRYLKSIDIDVLRTLKAGFFSEVYLSVNSEYALDKLVRLLTSKGIRSMLFKGSVLQNYYPCHELRTMGDRDILIRNSDREKADRCMLSLGYSRYVDNPDVWTYIKPNTMFEIHDVMFYENLSKKVDYKAYFSHVWDTAIPLVEHDRKIGVYVPDPRTHFIYVIAHTAKHIANNGMGFRAFLDMVFFWENAFDAESSEDDWNYIKVELKALQLYEFTCTCFSLCEIWFDIKMPFVNEHLDSTFKDEITEKMFKDGVFGLSNIENKGAKTAKEIKRFGPSYNRSAFRLTLKNLFPSYSDMRTVPWYSWIDRKPWLLPAAWIYRWAYCLKNKWTSGRDLLLEPYKEREKIEVRKEYLVKWGL